MEIPGYNVSADAAPQLWMNAGAALAASIRQIGTNVMNHLTEIRTRQDTQDLSNDLQTLDPSSPTFGKDLVAAAAKHPVAMNDRRGAGMIQTFGQMWRDQMAERRAATEYGRDISKMGTESQLRIGERAATEQSQRNRPIEMTPGNVLLDPTTGQEIYRAPFKPMAGSVRPTVLRPGSVAVDEQGNEIARGLALPERSDMTDYQAKNLDMQGKRLNESQMAAASRAKKDAIASKTNRLSILQRDLSNRESAWGKLQSDSPDRGVIGAEIERLGAQRSQIQKDIETLEATPAAQLLPATDERPVSESPNQGIGAFIGNLFKSMRTGMPNEAPMQGPPSPSMASPVAPKAMSPLDTFRRSMQ